MKKLILSLLVAVGLIGSADASTLIGNLPINTYYGHSYRSRYDFLPPDKLVFYAQSVDTYSVDTNTPLIGVNLLNTDSINLNFSLPQGEYFSVKDPSAYTTLSLSLAYAPGASWPGGGLNPLWGYNAGLTFNYLDGSSSNIRLGGLGLYSPDGGAPPYQAFFFLVDSSSVPSSSFNNATGFSFYVTRDGPLSSGGGTYDYYNVGNLNGNDVNKLAFYTSTSSTSDPGASVIVVPEPCTYALFGIGAVGMLLVMRRKKTA